jgi:beta-hydroxylase
VSLLAPKFLVLYLFLASALYVHLRGRVRFRFTRQLFNHSTLLAPYNALMYLFSAVPARPVIDPAGFPELAPLAANWTTIRDEAQRLFDEGYIRGALANNDVGFNSFFKRGWKRFYLKWYGDPLPSAATLCPQTVAMLQRIPSVKAAMFALLEPGAKLNPHRDPFAGSLRYHLGLITPNSDACFIEVDGEKLVWHDGAPIMFDETFIHWAQNKTDVTRVILFCDIERPLNTRFMRWLNRAVSTHVVKVSATQNVPTEPVGALNRLYGNVIHPVISRIGGAFKALKQRNRTLANAVKYALIAGILYLIFVWAA